MSVGFCLLTNSSPRHSPITSRYSNTESLVVLLAYHGISHFLALVHTVLPSGMLFCFVSLEAFLLFRWHIFWIDFLVITNGNFVLFTLIPSNVPRFTFTQPQSNLFILISPREEFRSKAQVPSTGVLVGRGGEGIGVWQELLHSL